MQIDGGTIKLGGSAGTNGQVLTSGGAGSVPTWTTLTGGSLASTQTWTGINTWTTPGQSAFSYGVTVGSLSVTGSGAGGIRLSQGVDSSVIPTANSSTLWGSSSSGTIVFSNGVGSSTWTVVGTSVTSTVGQCAIASNTTGGVIWGTCGTGVSGGAGYAMQPATVTIQAAQGLTVSTVTVYTTAPTTPLVVQSTNNVTVFSVSNSSVSAGDFLLTISSVPTNTTPPASQQLFTVDTYGEVGLMSYAKATLATMAPKKTGAIVGCSDCTALLVCISTGTAAGQWASPVAKTTGCN
jgi:hypothetical protein